MRILTKHIASYLLSATPLFSSGRYTLYAEVDPCSILYKGEPVVKEDHRCFDLILCQKSDVVAGIVCDPETEDLFTLFVPSIPYVKLEMEDDPLPFAVDQAGFPLPSEDCLQILYVQLLNILRSRHDPNVRRCTLQAIPISVAAAFFKKTASELTDAMTDKGLLDCGGTPTAYGTGSGLFLYCEENLITGISTEIRTTVSSLKAIHAALTWKKPRQKKRMLSERIAQLTEPATSTDAYAVPALKKLLSASLETLFRDYPAARNKLRSILMRSDAYLPQGSFSPVTDLKHISYRECLMRISALWCQLEPNPWMDDSRQASIRNTCEQLLLQLALPFWIPDMPVSEMDPPPKRQCLDRRLKRYRSGGSKEFAVIYTPLAFYYQAAACLLKSDYPNWLYRRKIRPLLTQSTHLETEYHLETLVKHCHTLHENINVNDREETMPLLYNLLVEPIIPSINKA